MQYIVKLSIALTVVYLFYWLLLRRLTFYNWNRWFLLFYSMACFFIPLVNIVDLLQRQGWQDTPVVRYIPVIVTSEAPTASSLAGTGIDVNVLLGMLMMAGCILMLGRLLIQFLSLKRLRASAELLSDGQVKLYHVDRKIIPFSTRSAIYVNRHLHDEQELKEIIHHEFIHVKQRHSVDLWWGEILCILNWFNPFAWLIRKAIRQNLEFIADHQVLQSGLDRKQYQYLLLKVTGAAPFRIASNFNFSSLKKRIVMMNKSKSANVHLMRFLFMVPLLVVVLLAFRNVAVRNHNYNTQKPLVDTIPVQRAEIEEAFEKRGIKEIAIQADGKNTKAKVTLKNGTIKTYNLSDPQEREAFEEAYGDLTPPAPPAPAAAPRPGKIGYPVPPAPAAAPKAGYPAPPPPAKAPRPAKTDYPAPPAPVGAPVISPAESTPPQPPTPPAPVKAENMTAYAAPAEATLTGTGVVTADAAPVALAGRVQGVNVRQGHYAPTAAGNHRVTPTTLVLSGNVHSITTSEKTTFTADHLTVNAGTGHQQENTLGVGHKSERRTPILVIKNTATRAELDQAIRNLKEKGYTLELQDIVYVRSTLVALAGTISNGTVKSSFTASQFKQFELYDHNKKTEPPLVQIYNGMVSIEHNKIDNSK